MNTEEFDKRVLAKSLDMSASLLVAVSYWDWFIDDLDAEDRRLLMSNLMNRLPGPNEQKSSSSECQVALFWVASDSSHRTTIYEKFLADWRVRLLVHEPCHELLSKIGAGLIDELFSPQSERQHGMELIEVMRGSVDWIAWNDHSDTDDEILLVESGLQSPRCSIIESGSYFDPATVRV